MYGAPTVCLLKLTTVLAMAGSTPILRPQKQDWRAWGSPGNTYHVCG